jgi:hypothetical protein
VKATAAPDHYLLIEQLLPVAGDGVRIQGEEFGQNRIAAMPQLHRFQTSEQAALQLVEQAVEEQNGLEFIGRAAARRS